MVSPATEKIIGALPAEMATALRDLRTLILKTAAENPAVGPLEETLKWNEPAFLTSKTKSGTTIRFGQHKKSATEYALYVSCQTDLVARYKELYGDVLEFEGARAVIFNVNQNIPVEAVRHCIAMALTYHIHD